MAGLTQEGSETPAELTEAPEKYGDFPGYKATDLVPLNLRDPQPASLFRVPCRSLCSRTSCQLPSKEPGQGWEGARTVRLLNVVIDLDHVLVVAESLDEVGGLLQVRVSQPHHCVGDEF